MKIELEEKPNIEALKEAAHELSNADAMTEALSKDAVSTLKRFGITVDAKTAQAIESKAKRIKSGSDTAAAAGVVHIDLP